MPEGPDGKTIIIVKKVSGHGGHHGGAWKVAYADFVTAMMALFLVLWLVNSASVATRERIASYFRRPGVFEEGSGTPLQIGGGGILPEAFAPPAENNAQTVPSQKIYGVDSKGGPKAEGFKGDGDKFENTEDSGEKEEGAAAVGAKGEGAQGLGKGAEAAAGEKQQFETAQREIEKTVEKNAAAIAGAIGKIDVKLDQRGLHLEIMDTPTASMFNLGSPKILPEAEKELVKIAEILKKLPNPVDIEGHTDATPFRSKNGTYDNWDLSIDRASAARRILQESGVEERQIARVVGYAAQRPKQPENALDPSNRRISISMRYTELAAKALSGTQTVETVSRPLLVKKEGAAAAPSAEPTKAPPAAAAAQPAPPAKGLAVEMTTTMPEGAEPEKAPAETTAPRPVWVEKDKIFGFKNPFSTSGQ